MKLILGYLKEELEKHGHVAVEPVLLQ